MGAGRRVRSSIQTIDGRHLHPYCFRQSVLSFRFMETSFLLITTKTSDSAAGV
jgi:hypothetical protein